MDAKERVALFGGRIKHLRQASGLSQDALATAIGYGSRGSIANIESGRQEPPLSMALALADFFGVLLEDLTAEEPRASPDPASIAVHAFLAGLPPRKRQTAVDKLLPALKELAGDCSAPENSVTFDGPLRRKKSLMADEPAASRMRERECSQRSRRGSSPGACCRWGSW